MANRRLTLRREVLAEIDHAGLAGVGGAGTGAESFSCLDYVSCNPLDCVTRWTVVVTTAIDTTGCE